MQIYHFTEQPYAEAWEEPILRVTLPNSHCDPDVAAARYNRYLDEYLLADELGLNVMINEHHSTATCLAASANIFLGILARQTKQARLLALGVPIANRTDPLRVAEELAMVDVISGGRLEMGFVKGVPTEVPIANTNPVRMMDRFWEAHDLILKAMTSQDGPFSWQGEYYHYRSVNIWPRPMQQPHPPVWITALTATSAPAVARRGHVIATVLGGFGATRTLFDTYRKIYAESGRSAAGRDRFAYAALAAVGSSESEARRRGEIVRQYLTHHGAKPQFKTPPGYFSPEVLAKFMKTPPSAKGVTTTDPFKSTSLEKGALDDLIDTGVMLCGTPDQVFNQIVRLDDALGGIGNLILMAQAGHLNHADTADSLKLFAKEVMPRLKEKYGDLSLPAEAA